MPAIDRPLSDCRYLGRGAWHTRVQDCESVGTVYMLPAKVYRQQPGKPVPPIHFPTAFTEHYPVVHFAKYVLGMPVRTDMAIEAEHAYLPKYGMEWHSEPMESEHTRTSLSLSLCLCLCVCLCLCLSLYLYLCVSLCLVAPPFPLTHPP